MGYLPYQLVQDFFHQQYHLQHINIILAHIRGNDTTVQVNTRLGMWPSNPWSNSPKQDTAVAQSMMTTEAPLQGTLPQNQGLMIRAY